MKEYQRMTLSIDPETAGSLARQAAMGRVLSGVGHELNNKFAAILGYTELLLQGAEGNSRETLDMLSIKDAARKCEDLTSALMSLTSRKRSKTETFELDTTVAKVLTLLEKHLQSGNIKIVCEFPPAPILMEAPKGDFMAVTLLALLKLADAAPRGTRITVRLDRASAGVVELEMAAEGVEYPKLQPSKFLDFLSRPIMNGDVTDDICGTVVEMMGGTFMEERGARGPRRFVMRLPVAEREKALAAV